jgi:hypothetical protein
VRLLISILLFLPALAWAQLTVRPVEARDYRAGDVAAAEIVLTDAAWFNRLTTARLRALLIDEVLWVQSVEPWQAKGGVFTARAKLVLGGKLDMTTPLVREWDGKPLTWRFEGWRFTPGGGAEEDLEFVGSVAPSRWRWPTWGNWILALFAMAGILIALLLPKWWLRRCARRALERERALWIERLDAARDLSAVSKLWSERDALLAAWPTEEAALRSCFEVLNRHQFRPRVDEDGIREVLAAKAILRSQLSGRRDGV